MVVGQYRRLLSTTAVRAQAMCLLARVGLVTPAAKEAAGRRELAMRLSEAMKRERRAQAGQGEATVTRSRKDCLIVFYELILPQPIFHSDFDDLVILWNKCWKKKITGEKSIFFGLNCCISSYCIA